ncbi:hypothetical protein [Flavobacterium pectinovorum]|uniref:Uncharacterized protein n=1 Tax=Flavobacterium pectinovorum TaxID=29533 RepID=A0A502EX56_9FLAO|nr:hypothetical protein [Flavobacterium pectinovorum]TPG41624.1 hypothetical protein EAH81_09085 [Flavobacterium pectinovorum]
MKNNILFILILFPIFNFAQTGQVLDFKIGYAPQTVYTQILEQSSETELHYIGSDELLEKLKNKGVANPTLAKTFSIMESVCKTGKTAKDGNFPVTIEFNKSTNSENKIIIPDGTILYGIASTSTMPKLDSIISKDLDESFKSTLLSTIQSMFSQIALPEKKMKIGESFSQETPLKIPIAGLSMDMQITTIYKLISVTNQTANFDIDQKYVLDVAMLDGKYNINAEGGGNGKLLYDIPNHFATQFKLDIGLTFDLKQETFGLKVKSNSNFNQTIHISKN